jgi:FMN phosphatase YigB (HAD superfamily)
MNDKPERRDAAVDNSDHPGDEQQLCLHVLIVTGVKNISERGLEQGFRTRGKAATMPALAAEVFALKKDQPKNKHKPRIAPLIRCVIFDLDDTLYDCFGQRVRPAHRHAAEAMVNAGLQASVEAVYRARMRAFRRDPMLRHIDGEVCRRFNAADPEAVSRAARDAYFNCPVERLALFRGSKPLLRFLHSRGVRVFIVSFGEPEIQRAKVRALGLENDPTIDHIFYADRDKLLTKDAAFRKIQHELGLPAGEMLVVGDRPMREIRASNELGMHTVRIRHGEFAAQEAQSREEEPEYEVRNISEVRELPFFWGRSTPIPRRHEGTEKFKNRAK